MRERICVACGVEPILSIDIGIVEAVCPRCLEKAQWRIAVRQTIADMWPSALLFTIIIFLLLGAKYVC